MRAWPIKPPIGTPIGRGPFAQGLLAAWLLQEGPVRYLNYANPNNTGTVGGTAPTLIATPWGVAASFNGGGIRTIVNPPPTTLHFTWMARVYSRALSGFQSLYANASTGIFLVGSKLQHYSLSASTANLSVNTWYTLAVTKDGTTTRYYINGQLDSTRTGAVGLPDNGANPLGIGSDSASENFNGIIDYTYLWNRPLPPEALWEIATDPFTAVFTDTQPFGVDALTAAQELGLPTLASGVTLFTPTVGAQEVALPTVVPGTTVGPPLVVLEQDVSLPTIASGAQVFPPAPTYVLALPTIASTALTPTPIITLGYQFVTLPTVGPVARVFPPRLIGNEQTISLPTHASTAAVRAPSITAPTAPGTFAGSGLDYWTTGAP